jgi:uncharacterized membrane protein YkvA (DUF1232 family)
MAGTAIATANDLRSRRPVGAKRLRPWVVLLLGLVVLAGCLSTRFIYNQIDWLTVWYLSDVFDLRGEQKDELRLIVARNLDWVRTEQLPEYARLLREVDAGAQDGSLSVAQLESHFGEMIAMWDRFLRRVIPDMAYFLGLLDDEQVASFVANSAEKNEELWEEYAGDSAEERLERREKSAIKNLQRFTGRLTDPQRALIRGHLARMYDNSAEWMAGRREWQKNFQALVLERPPQSEFEARLRGMMLDPNAVDSEDYRRQVDANRVILFEMFIDLVASLDAKQRQRLSERLLGFAEDFERLAADPKLNEQFSAPADSATG